MNDFQGCVVDASVAIKLFIDEPLSDQAHLLFGRLTDLPPLRLYAPDLLYIECTNILWKAVTRLGLPQYDASIALAQLGQLLIHVTPSLDLATNALDLAILHRISAYDAAYVALAQQLGLPLITADQPLVQALRLKVPTVLWLGAL